MSSTFKVCFKESIHNLLCCFNTDNSCTKRYHVGIVVSSGIFCTVRFRADAASDTIHFITGNPDTNTCTTDGNTFIYFTFDYGIGTQFSIIWIIYRIIGIRTKVYYFIAFTFQVSNELLLHFHCSVVICNSYFHIVLFSFFFFAYTYNIIPAKQVNKAINCEVEKIPTFPLSTSPLKNSIPNLPKL